MTQNITKYEKDLYTSNLISSLLSQANFKRLFSSLRITNNLQQLTYILQTAGINALLAKLSNALLKVTPVCVIRNNQCVTHNYLSQSADNECVLLHEISSKLTRSTSALVTCTPQLGEKGWEIPSLNRQRFILKKGELIDGNLSLPVKLLDNST